MASAAAKVSAPRKRRSNTAVAAAIVVNASKPAAKKKPLTGDNVSRSMLIAGLNPRGNTVLKDFGRVIRDEPHKYIYPIKLYLTRDGVDEKLVMDWLRDRYINAKGGRNHGARYEARTYRSGEIDGDGKAVRFIDYLLLERFTDEERFLFTMQFGDVTEDKVVRDGKLRRPRLNKAQKERLDGIVDYYYLRIARERQREAAAKAAARSAAASQ